jgi:integrase
MAKAVQLPSGAWRVRVNKGYDANGKRIVQSITRPTKKEAEYAALEVELHYKDISRDPAAMTLSEAAQQYIDSRREISSPATISGYQRIFKNYFKNIQHLPLRRITQAQIQKEIDSLARSHSPKTIANAHGLLNAVYKEFHPSFELKTKLPKKKPFMYHIPDSTEIPQIFAAVKGSDIEIPVHLAVLLGLRVSEIRALRFEDIRTDSIVVDSAIVDADRVAYEKSTKSYSGTRIIPAPSALIKKIKALPHESEKDYVTKLSGNAVYKQFVRRIEKAGLPHMRFHDLRHANASVMLLLGIPDKYAMERLGHATPSTLRNVYQHTMVKEKMEVAERINQYFESLTDED